MQTSSYEVSLTTSKDTFIPVLHSKAGHYRERDAPWIKPHIPLDNLSFVLLQLVVHTKGNKK